MYVRIYNNETYIICNKVVQPVNSMVWEQNLDYSNAMGIKWGGYSLYMATHTY